VEFLERTNAMKEFACEQSETGVGGCK